MKSPARKKKRIAKRKQQLFKYQSTFGFQHFKYELKIIPKRLRNVRIVSLYCNSVSLDPRILCNHFYIWTSTVYLFAVHSALKADGQTLKGLPNTWMTVSICVLY